MKKCIYYQCDNEVKSKNKRAKFCSSKCAGAHKSRTLVESWLNGEWDGNKAHGLSPTVRNFLLEEAGNKCEKCGWNEINEFTGKVPLEINHIDGHYLNSARENLEVLCPNCHSLTENYKALNKSGRAWRKNYPQYELKGRRPLDLSRFTCLCGAKKDPGSKACQDCHKAKTRSRTDSKYPDLFTLIDMVEKLGYEATGRKIGVTGNAVKKRLRSRGVTPLPNKKVNRG